jgi:molybdenum cofactor biosynthesis enzyme MoaA
MDINKQTFCAAPWFAMRNQNSGEFRVCCEHDIESSEFNGKTIYNSDDSLESWMNSDYQKYLREQLNNGVKVTECRKCWDREDSGLISLRQNINSMITNNRDTDLDNTWIPVYFKNKKDYVNDLLLIADIKINNVCNFSCAMCNARDSSLIYNEWASQPNNEFVSEYTDNNPDYFIEIKQAYQLKNGIQVLDEVLKNPIKFLKILGGEPLLNSKLIKRLTEIPESHRKKIDLVFITNGSVDLVDISQQLQGFNRICYTISTEATGNIQDYIRRGSNWIEIEKNIDNLLKYKQTSSVDLDIEIHTTIQALNILYYADLRTWCKDRNLKHTITVLQVPEYLSLSVVNEELKQQVISILKTLVLDDNAEGLISILKDTKYNSELAEKFVRFIKWYDPELKLLDIDSRWKGLFV